MTIHKPVLLQEAVESLKLKIGDVVFDGTLGGGGYSQEILKKIGPTGILIATDLDQKALDNFKNTQARLRCKNYAEIKNILLKEELEGVDKIVLDLGISSDQLAESGRGISFQNLEEKLDMNLSDNSKEKLTAAKICNEWLEENIADIIFYYGGEKAAKKIARAIVLERENKDFEKVKDLVDLLEKNIGKFYQRKRIHCATKTFQALRIAVNNEIGNLKKLLKDGQEILTKNGRIAIVSFHSLEDKIVKKQFRKWEDQGLGRRINKKVIISSKEELENNTRSRSAKLRVFKKNKIKNCEKNN